MKVVQKEFKVYKFEELPAKIKTQVCDTFRYDLVEDSYWYEYLKENFEAQLKQLGFTNVTSYFSGFGSQGDGACFDGEVTPENILNFMTDKKYKKLKYCIEKGLISLSGVILKNSYGFHYSHEKTRYFEILSDFYVGDTKKRVRIEKLIEDLEKDIERLRCSLAINFYNQLEEEYDFLTSDEQVIDFITSNDLDFLENGAVFN